MEDYKVKHKEVFAIIDENKSSIKKEELIEMSKKLLKTDEKMCQEFCEKFIMHDFTSYLIQMREYIYSVAHDNNKKIEIHYNCSNSALVFDKRFGELLINLSHLFSNAITHGIESREERKRAGKDEVGKLNVDCFKDEKSKFSIMW